MRKLILIAHISLDGFVSGPNGTLDWFQPGEENLEFVGKLTETADSALFGRISYKLLNDYWPTAKDEPNASNGQVKYSNWYNRAQKIVISRTLANAGLKNTIVIKENILSEVASIKNNQVKTYCSLAALR